MNTLRSPASEELCANLLDYLQRQVEYEPVTTRKFVFAHKGDQMRRYQVVGLCMFFSITASEVQGQDYPDMVGLWKGAVRIVQSGQLGTDRLQAGGAIISEIDLELIIDAQDGETFIGRTRSSQTPANAPITHVWGSIRSTGGEALFITSAGGRGQLWFESATRFEYCYNDIDDTDSIVSYCARLEKQ